MASISYLYVIATLVLCCLGTVVYRLFFHPLAGFPGPKLAAATGWYLAYFDMLVDPGAQVMFELQRLHRIHGTFIRMADYGRL